MNTEETSILLGNGFNMALNNIIQLDYTSIAQKALAKLNSKNDITDDDKNKMVRIINKCENDLEFLLYILEISEKCIEKIDGIYTTNSSPQDQMHQHKLTLKKMVIDILLDRTSHPEYQEFFKQKNLGFIDNCASNLKLFNRIYTINYDLILYWILCNKNLIKKDTSNTSEAKFSDGFSANVYDNDIEVDNSVKKHLHKIYGTNTKPTLLYLHGALHLLKYKNRGYKIVREKNTPLTLTDLREKILNCTDTLTPLIVFDATSKEKYSYIYENNYLFNSFEKIRTTSGRFIIYGCKPIDEKDNNDEHLWRRIINSNIKKLFISCNSENNDDLQERANSFKKILNQYQDNKDKNNKLTYYAFSYQNINIWRCRDFCNRVELNAVQASD